MRADQFLPQGSFARVFPSRVRFGASSLKLIGDWAFCGSGVCETRTVARNTLHDCLNLIGHDEVYSALNLATALPPSETACLARSPGRTRRTAVWISRDPRVFLSFMSTRRAPSRAILSKISVTKEFMTSMALLEIPISGWTCLRTLKM